mgnify:CR=1 FL=1
MRYIWDLYPSYLNEWSPPWQRAFLAPLSNYLRLWDFAAAAPYVEVEMSPRRPGPDAELDYKDELMQSGFVFQNPNVKKACGCGASFTV